MANMKNKEECKSVKLNEWVSAQERERKSHPYTAHTHTHTSKKYILKHSTAQYKIKIQDNKNKNRNITFAINHDRWSEKLLAMMMMVETHD